MSNYERMSTKKLNEIKSSLQGEELKTVENILAERQAKKDMAEANKITAEQAEQLIEKKVKKDSKPREKRVFTQEQVSEILKEMHANVGKTCVKNETEGRIVGITLDRRSMMFMYKILTKEGKKIHCAYDKLNIGDLDDEGQQMQKNHVYRRLNMNSETAGMTKAEKLEYKLAKLKEQIAALQEQLAKEQAEKDMAKEERLD